MIKVGRKEFEEIIRSIKNSKDFLSDLDGRGNEVAEIVIQEFGFKSGNKAGEVRATANVKNYGYDATASLKSLYTKMENKTGFSVYYNEHLTYPYGGNSKLGKLKTGGWNYRNSIPVDYLFMTDEKIRADIQDNIKNGAKLAAIRRQKIKEEVARKAKMKEDALAKLSPEERKLLKIRVPRQENKAA